MRNATPEEKESIRKAIDEISVETGVNMWDFLDKFEEEVRVDMKKYVSEREYSVCAPDQTYTEEFLKQIREEDLVVYDGNACHAVRIIPRKGRNPLFEILGEDDGHLFTYDHQISFDMSWTDSLIKQLNDAKKYWEEIKDNYK